MTAVDRSDNGQDELVWVQLPADDVAFLRGFDPDRDRTASRADMVRVIEHLQTALASGRAGAGEQQREQVARFLVSVAYGPRTDGENWFDHLIPAGQEKFLTHADELLALLGGPQPDEPVRQHRMDAGCWCQPVQADNGAWDHR